MVRFTLVTALLSSVLATLPIAPGAVAQPRRPGASCSLRAPDKCTSTGQIVRDSGFRKELAALLAGRRDDLFHSRESTGAQVLEGLGGPPDAPVKLSDGSYLFSACRFQSCTEKAAVIIGNSRHISAIGVIYYPAPLTGTASARQPQRIFYRAGEGCPVETNALTRWSDGKLKDLRAGRAFAETAVIRVRGTPASRRACTGVRG